MSEKGFFPVSISTLHQIVDAGGEADSLVAYLVLAKHTSSRGAKAHRVSTAGAKAVANKTGISYHKAEKALEWLHANAFIEKPAPAEGVDVKKSRSMQPRWILGDLGDDLAYLSHSLVEGIGRGVENPPLKRIWEETLPGKCKRLMDARADVLMLLVHCYKEQHIQDYGGVNPACLHVRWKETDYLQEALEPLVYLVMEIEKEDEVTTNDFVNTVYPSISPDERAGCFWSAFSNIKKMGLIYEVLEVWSGNPITDRRAELHYPLYVMDYHARNTDPYCLKETHNFLRDRLNDSDLIEVINDGVENRKFRLIKTTKKNSYVIGTMRMRFRPHTKEIAQGMEHEQRRADRWIAELERAN